MTRLERAQAKLGRQHAHAFKHAAERAAQRFGLKLEVSDYRKAERAIRTGQVPVELKHRAGETTVTVIVKMRGRPVRAVYDLATERIVTVLPLIPKPAREKSKKWGAGPSPLQGVRNPGPGCSAGDDAPGDDRD